MTLLDDILQKQLSRSGELLLVTSVLGASASWYGHSFLAKILSAGDTVIHLSFIHDATFHSDCVRKWGVDLGLYGRKGKYVFIDGLSGLFYQQPGAKKGNYLMFSGPNLQGLFADVKARIKKAVPELVDGSKTCLIVENPDILLSAGGLLSIEVVNELMDWNELVSSTTVMVNADSALVSRSRTRLEMEESSFVTTLAHQASSVTSLRMLDTGLAKDVSGVLRVTTASNTTSSNRQNGQDWNEKEVLYFVRDGSVEVFNRGQMRA
ncbi:hypothetical protein BDD12DRAFT_126095 [Trichophaea hybrida]|nr:hypothetical protein BDD12DRAFT_126095 [Trichophaea hybrida]